MLALALLYGAPGFRTGLEDAVYISRGVLAESNAALVTAAIKLAQSVGREVATQEQTRALLGLAPAE
jgi:uncharacterized protein (DUF849 family)